MMESPKKTILLVTRSRPFLFCVILFLCGFLLMHYLESISQVGIIRTESRPTTYDVRDIGWLPVGGVTRATASTTQAPASKKKNVQKTFNRSDSDIHHIGNIASQRCKKQFDVSFLKVHKAGSTTLMNIFLRFAISNDLNVVLPHKSDGFGFNYLGYGTTLSDEKIVPLPANETYNILCNHVVYNKQAFRAIMPPDTVYVGILREPKSHFTSASSYYGFYNKLLQLAEMSNMSSDMNVIGEYLKNPDNFKVPTYFVKNRMSFDFGIPKERFHDDNFVDNYIEDLDRDYALVMMMERFHESLVLMKRILCWNTKDILYVPLNAMAKKVDFNLSSVDIQRLQQWNSADFKLYNHFNDVFNRKIAVQSSDFQEEVESFKSVQKLVKEFCLRVVTNRKSPRLTLKVPMTKWDSSFLVTKRDCSLMTEHELTMMKRLIQNAWARFDAATNNDAGVE